MGPADLASALQFYRLPAPADPAVLVDNRTRDDAGVYRLDAHTALVQTVDFFTPVVDDPHAFGAIAAANALSDVYAMGGRPLTALNLLAVPAGVLEPEWVGAMLNGGAAVLAESGTVLLGGHSIDDPEPKLGYAITGLVHPEHIWRNSTARPGDVLFLTKPIGTGVVIKGIKDATAEPAEAEAATRAMRALNRAAADLVHEVLGDPHACTDVTGYGLLGHLWEMAEAADVAMAVNAAAVPLLPGCERLARADAFPAGSRRNFEYVMPHTDADPMVEEWRLRLLADAVTSGGLLLAVDSADADRLQRAAAVRGLAFHRIGRVLPGPARLVVEA